jgi:hypothetical protein
MKSAYSFVKSPEELTTLKNMNGSLSGCEKLQLQWVIAEDTYCHLLPTGVEPAEKPIVVAYVSTFHQPDTLKPYSECGCFLTCIVNGHPGILTLAMVADFDGAILSGREFYGYPKKLAKVKLIRTGDRVVAWAERNGIRFFSAEAVTGAPNDPVLSSGMTPEKVYLGRKASTRRDEYVHYLKYDADIATSGDIRHVDWQSSIHNIRLHRQLNEVDDLSCEHMYVLKLVLTPSMDDPWCELAPTKVIGATYEHNDTFMRGAETIRVYGAGEREAILPFLFSGWDSWIFGRPLR